MQVEAATMMFHPRSRVLIALGLAVQSGGCASEEIVGPREAGVEALQVDDAWVFTYERTPDENMEALTSGPAAVVDGCLQVGDAVVVWYDHHLGDVEDIVARVHSGEAVEVTLGGGGFSLEEGDTTDDFPDDVLSRCSASEIWYSGPDEVVLEEGS